MDHKKRIVVAYSNRSEYGLLVPVIKRLKRHFEVVEFDMGDMGGEVFELGGLYEKAFTFIRESAPVCVITPFDRKEQIFVALAARMLNLRVAQIHAGDISREGCWDDQVRHMISLCCDYLFCNGEESAERARRLVRLTGSSAKVYEVGSSAFDDIEVDMSSCPDGKFDLIVYSPPTKRPDLIEKELDEIESLLDKPAIWIGPSGDPGSDLVIGRVREIQKRHDVVFYQNLPRPKFLGLLKRCERPIGNSSSFFLELPYFGKRHVHIGARNKGREVVKIRPGGSDRIAEILRKELADAED